MTEETTESGSRAAPCSQVLTSYPCDDTRHLTGRYMICSNCNDKRKMKITEPGVYQCRGCGQRWKYPTKN